MTAPFQHKLKSLAKSIPVRPRGCDEHRSERVEKSSKTDFKERFQNYEDDQSYRKFFNKRWQKHIVENYGTDPKWVTKNFPVSEVTADNWINGFNAPQGWVIGHALKNDPANRDSLIDLLIGESP